MHSAMIKFMGLLIWNFFLAEVISYLKVEKKSYTES